MLKTVILAENPLEPDSWEQVEVEDVCEFLVSRFSLWPPTGRIYHEQVAECNDVTPNDEDGIEKLQSLEGSFYVIIYPEGPAAIVIAIVIAVAVVAAAFFMQPKVKAPSIATRLGSNRQNKSPNNELSERKNSPRPNGRIPDIFGEVRSTPDLIAVPYTLFIAHQEVEHAYMCIGRGYYDISDIRDDTTLVTDIAGTSIEVYAPNTSPNSGHAPQLRIGNPINTLILNAKRSNAVNGQVLRPPNDQNVVGNNNIRFMEPNEIQTTDANIDFTDKFEAGDTLVLSNASATVTIDPVPPDEDPTTEVRDFSGTYTVLAVSDSAIVLSSPSSVNPAWTGAGTTSTCNATMNTSGPKWVGPFTLSDTNLEQVFVNVVAQNGLYKDDGYTQVRMDVTVELELTPVDVAGNATGPAETFQATIEGSATLTSTRATTIKANPTFTGRCKARMRRITNSDLSYKGSVIDEVKWRDMFSVTPVAETDFGNVTTVQSVTYATAGALAIKERKLNMLVTRKLPQRVTGSTFTTELYPTTRADEIISAICLDPYIGNRNSAELNFDSIYSTVAEAEAYFGTEKAVQFCYTFDKDDLSFEETISSVAGAVFCVAYRRGNVINLSFEKLTDDSTLLFNHRNKLPGSETRTVNFGYTDDNDGVEFEYVSPEDDALVTYYLPEDRSAVNPKKIESIGVRSKVQAHFHAWRIWNKIRYQNVSVEFDATQEADLLVPQDRIIVADNTRPDTQDGDVRAQDGLVVNTSQPLKFEDGKTYTAFLQLHDETVESIPVTPGPSEYQFVLGRAPRLPLVANADYYAQTTYIITSNTDVRPMAFLVGEKRTKDNFTSTIIAANYDNRYYAHDTDFINDLIAE